jgi:hypothetical protein
MSGTVTGGDPTDSAPSASEERYEALLKEERHANDESFSARLTALLGVLIFLLCGFSLYLEVFLGHSPLPVWLAIPCSVFGVLVGVILISSRRAIGRYDAKAANSRKAAKELRSEAFRALDRSRIEQRR